jgi:hypothetical protein
MLRVNISAANRCRVNRNVFEWGGPAEFAAVMEEY